MEFDERWKKIAADSIGRSASDIHLMEGGSVYLRVDGRLKKMDDDTVLSREWMEGFLTASGGNVPDYSFEYGGRAFRVHAYTAAGKKMASLRLVPPSVPSLSEIGAPDGMSRALSLAHGLLLVCGRTGQGKTTTLAAIIDGWLKQHDGHLVTLEDPVEYRFTGGMISQMELGRDFHSFPEAMRDVIRMDPDIIMVSEIRDRETCRAAIQAAEAGFYVLGSLHTSNASEAILRLVSLAGGDATEVREALAAILVGIISQRLVMRKNGGRALAAEVMWTTTAVRNLIRSGRIGSIASCIMAGQSDGMQTMEMSLSRLAAKGIISINQAWR